MRRTLATLAVSSVLASVCCFATLARAGEASDTDKDSKGSDADKEDAKDTSEGDAEKDAEKKDDAEKPAKSSAAEKDEGAKDDNSPVEVAGKTYYFVGLRYRGIIVPSFLESLFASGGTTLYVHGIGPEFAIRKDNFEFNLSPWLAFYNMDETAFKGKNDPETAWELVSTKITMLYLTSDFLWSHPFSPEWALNYGFGAGFGIVFGNVYRSQSYPTAPGQDPNNYSKCQGVGQPASVPATAAYCDNSNNYYNGYSEPSWANGGSKPILFPWLAVQTGVRFKPSRTIAARLDVGFGTSGFFFGLGGDYGL
jgi:hypothetical protein